MPTSPTPGFVHLHTHTEFSMLDGAARLGDLMAATKASGMSAIATTDHGYLFGAYEFWSKGVKHGVKPIIGLERGLTDPITELNMGQTAEKVGHLFGITRAQWAVLAKIERSEGMKQSELAELMEMQPITLTRLIDKLCDNGWIERRNDENDRRVNRLYLKKAARPLLGKLAGLRSELTATALEGISPADAHRLLTQLESIKENVRNAIQSPAGEPSRKEQRYG